MDNGTEFVNQTLKAYYEDIGNSHQTSVARTPQQNDIVKRRNQTLMEAACTMLIFSKTPLFLWAEAVVAACYTHNRSFIRKCHNKTPYELLYNSKSDLSYLHVFGALCYPTNNYEDLGKLQLKEDIGIFVGYAPTKKASGPGPQLLTPETISSRLMPNPPSLTYSLNRRILKKQCSNPPGLKLFKKDELGGVLKNKARLVAKGYLQEEGIDFKESFAPVARIELKKALYGLKQALRAWMSMMGKMSLFLGLEISQSHRGIFINQSNYALEIIKKYGMLSSDFVDTPMVEKSKQDEDLQRKLVDPTHYSAYADSDHVDCQDTRRSTSGKAEYIALSGCCAQILWMRSQLTNYGLKFNKIHLYNQSAIFLCCNNVQHSRSKHIDVRYHFIKDQVENGVVELYFIRTEYQLADIFTKALPRERFNFLIEKLGLKSMSPETLKNLAEEEEV
ncbi:retrovirus-related pol polyprotein from transposon TNT 1-94 [Tanacetum coccineum]